jgi:hypothetical protein
MQLRPLVFVLISLILPAEAQTSMEQLLEINQSMVQISVDLGKGITGTGSGVVVSEQHVITNCHVLANAKGVNVAKYNDGYKPIAMKADWIHDLCLLIFDNLPFKPVPMRDSASLQHGEKVIVVSYPNDNNVPQPSYGIIKAIYPYEDSVILRSNAPFSLGSSGGAMFDRDFKLIGITTFKSPGRNAYFYSMPVEWIRKLFDAKDTLSLETNEIPLWALPEAKRPFFMRVVIPYQNEDWEALERIANEWLSREPDNADACYYLSLAERALNKSDGANDHLAQAIKLNPRHLDAQVMMAMQAIETGDRARAARIRDVVKALDVESADKLSALIELQ